MNLFFLQSTVYELVLLSIFTTSILVQLFYYVFIYLRVILYKKKFQAPLPNDTPPISVIVCARNEEHNLESFLPLLLEQKYPVYEVVVVNDCSTDDSDMVLKRLSSRYKHLKTTTIKPDEKFTHGKKLALTIGIKAAKFDWVLLTDADCKPEGNKWIATIASNLHHPNQVVLGYGGYMQKKGFLNKLIRYDTFFIALQYIGFALIGKPYMGVGRNLAYKKDLFFKNKGFALHNHLISGDDDLFVHRVASKRNTAVEFRNDAHTRSLPSDNFKEWISQKRRHLTTAPYYKRGIKIMLGIEPLTRILFWLSGILLLAQNYFPLVVLSLGAFRLLVTLVILKFAMYRLNERKIFLLSLFYELFSPVLFGTLMFANQLTQKQSKWN